MVVAASAVAEAAGPTGPAAAWEGLRPALRRLDALLARAVAAAERAHGASVGSDPFQGLHIGRDEVERLLAREPGTPLFGDHGDAGASGEPTEPDGPAAGSPLARLAYQFDLSAFDVDVALIALAPEIDLGYQRLYAYLQDDVTRRRPTVDLALRLLCGSPAEKLARRLHFAPDAPLLRHHVIQLRPDLHQVGPPLLAHELVLDSQIVDVLLGQPGIDRRLAAFCRLWEPGAAADVLVEPAPPGLVNLVRGALSMGRPVRLFFHGPRGVGKRSAAIALARTIGARLLYTDLRGALEVDPSLEQTLRLLFKEAELHGAILYLDGLDALRDGERAPASRRLLGALNETAGITILAGTEPTVADGLGSSALLSVPFTVPNAAQRRARWRAELALHDVTLSEPALETVAGRFHLMPSQIAAAAATVPARVAWRSAAEASEGATPAVESGATVDDLFAAARAQASRALGTLARKIEPVATWGDIVLPDDSLAQLHEICSRVASRERVLRAWGFGRKLSAGTGTSALFVGPTGTGKTMAAEILANELGLDLYTIDLAGVVSKYIGETEKNLDRVFAAAGDAMLFFDEADALFGKRSEVRDAHDRYANVEISYLLQKMERYEGVTILATNLRQNLDQAFVRRLAFTVAFPFPDDADRRRIWAGILPPETPLAEDVDLEVLAGRFPLSGGNIKNVALAAAFLAAESGSPVTMAHLLHATRREYQKLGKALSEAELHGAPSDPPAGEP